MKSNLKLCAIGVPSFGYKSHELMQDIAISVGATYFSEKTGDDLSLMTLDDLGFAAKVKVGRETTVIIKESDSSIDVSERVKELKFALETEKSKENKEFILSRIATLTGGVGVIYVGGQTDLEQKELYDRVDDAVCAVRSALEEGILPGGGVALYNASNKLMSSDNVADKILTDALRAPSNQICLNAGLDMFRYESQKPFQFGLNVKTGEYGDMYNMGVIDPVKVTRCALENAVSVAVTLLSTNAIITMARTYDDK